MLFWRLPGSKGALAKEIEVLGPAMPETKSYGCATVQDEFGGDTLEFVP